MATSIWMVSELTYVFYNKEYLNPLVGNGPGHTQKKQKRQETCAHSWLVKTFIRTDVIMVID